MASKEKPATGGDNDPANFNNGARQQGTLKLDWVTAIKGRNEWQQWVFEFRTGAVNHLDRDHFKSDAQYEAAWITCLTTAASRGNWDQMRSDVRTYSMAGIKGEQLLDKLATLYTRGNEVLKVTAYSKLQKLFRGSYSLTEMLNALERVLTECHSCDYKPDEPTFITVLQRVTTKAEMAQAQTRIKLDSSFDPSTGLTSTALIEALRDIAIIADTSKGSKAAVGYGGKSSGGEFAAGAYGQQRKGDKGKGKKQPRLKGVDGSAAAMNSVQQQQQQQKSGYIANNGKPCQTCGQLVHKKAGPCPALTAKCRLCDTTGHFQAVCTKKGNANALVPPRSAATGQSDF